MAMMMGRAKKRPALAFRPEAPVMPRSAAPAMPAVNPMAAMAAPQGMPAMKKGGKLKAVDKSKNPGISKLPTEVRNKMGYMKKGGMAKKKMKMGGMAYKEGGKADMAQDKKTVKKAVGMHEKQLHGGKKSDLAKLKSGGMAKCARGGGIEVRGKTKGRIC